jgi:hypothetical protein
MSLTLTGDGGQLLAQTVALGGERLDLLVQRRCGVLCDRVYAAKRRQVRTSIVALLRKRADLRLKVGNGDAPVSCKSPSVTK